MLGAVRAGEALRAGAHEAGLGLRAAVPAARRDRRALPTVPAARALAAASRHGPSARFNKGLVSPGLWRSPQTALVKERQEDLSAEIVILLGLARRTANKSEKVSLFYITKATSSTRLKPKKIP